MIKRNLVLDQEEVTILRSIINRELQEIAMDNPSSERSHQIQILDKLYRNLTSMTYDLQDQMNCREIPGFNS